MSTKTFQGDEFSSASITSLYQDGSIVKRESTDWPANASINDKVALIRHNITQLQVDAIVNPTFHHLAGRSGADGAIHFAAGPELEKECRTLGSCQPGDAKMTSAYKLPCKKVIHTVGPKYHILAHQGENGASTAALLLASCYRRCLEIAVQAGLRSIAFCAIATGAYGYPGAAAAEVALWEVRRFLDSAAGQRLDRVVFCNYRLSDEVYYKELIPKFFPPEGKNVGKPTSLPIRDYGKSTTVKVEPKAEDPSSEIDAEKELDWDQISECEYKCNKLNGETA